MAQTLTDIKTLLSTHGLRPKHRLGQNFLHDHNQMRRIVATAQIAAGDVVLEIGPGTGALTEFLLESGASVVAVEIDTDMEPILRQRLAAHGERFQLVVADILASKREINPEAITALHRIMPTPLLGRGHGTPSQPSSDERNPDSETSSIIHQPSAISFKLIANLPYNIASPLLINLAVDYPGMQRAVVMVQKEVADRLAAPPGGKDYGPMSVIIQAMCEVQRVAVIPPSCFWPQPEVESAITLLVRREQPLTRDPARLSALVQRLFQQRRKQIGTVLGRNQALPAGIDASMRPEMLTVAQLVALSESIPAEA